MGVSEAHERLINPELNAQAFVFVLNLTKETDQPVSDWTIKTNYNENNAIKKLKTVWSNKYGWFVNVSVNLG